MPALETCRKALMSESTTCCRSLLPSLYCLMPKDTEAARDQHLRTFPCLPTASPWVKQEDQQLIGGRCSKAGFPPQVGHHPILRNLLEQREEEGGICILACLSVEYRRHIPCFSVFYPRFIQSASLEPRFLNSVWIAPPAVLGLHFLGSIPGASQLLLSWNDVSEYPVYHGLPRNMKMQGSTWFLLLCLWFLYGNNYPGLRACSPHWKNCRAVRRVNGVDCERKLKIAWVGSIIVSEGEPSPESFTVEILKLQNVNGEPSI